jgi:hypothetical protein
VLPLPLLGLLLEGLGEFVPPQDGHALLSGVQVATDATENPLASRGLFPAGDSRNGLDAETAAAV